MSELSKHIEAHQTGNRKAVLPKPMAVHDSLVRPDFVVDVLAEYKIGCEFRVLSYARNAHELYIIQDVARKQIIEEVFGEFRKPLCYLRDALYRRDFEEADAIVRRIASSMFDE